VGIGVSTTVGETMAMSVSTKMGVTAPTTIAAVTQLKMRTFVPPFTAGVHESTSIPAFPYPKVRARIDDRFTTIYNVYREQPYGKPTSMMTNFHNNTSAFADHANPFTPFNSHSPSSSSTFRKNALLALTT